jgi:anti-anti-sigma regulatory factor
MALFSKPPAKKPLPPRSKPAAAAAPSSARPSARDVAAQAGAMGKDRKPKLEPVPADESITGASLIEWSPQPPQAFEVAQANPGLCAVLENAALLYASGQAAGARTLLEQGVAGDHDTKQSPLAWLALFDLLQRAGDRVAYEQLAIQYSVQFERSAPGWEGREVSAGPRTAGGYVVLTGRLTGDSAAQLEGLRRAVQKRVSAARLDLSSITEFDDAGARLLANALAEARKAELQLSIERMDKLKAGLDSAVKNGREGGEGAWLLSLELLQWRHDQALFDDRAIEYALAFEVSPPSWEPAPLALTAESSEASTTDAVLGAEEALAFSGVMASNAPAHATRLQEYAHGRQLINLDFSAVERIDFVCAGALLNAINRVEGTRKSVQVLGASPIIRALLLLIGLSPRHFVKKAV